MTPAEFVQPLGAIYSLFAAVERAGQEQRSVVRTLDVRADGVAAARLGLGESAPLVYLERLRLAADEPLAVDRVWLLEWLVAALLEVDFGRTALYDELARRCGVQLTGGQETIRAVVPAPGARVLLGIATPRTWPRWLSSGSAAPTATRSSGAARSCAVTDSALPPHFPSAETPAPRSQR